MLGLLFCEAHDAVPEGETLTALQQLIERAIRIIMMTLWRGVQSWWACVASEQVETHPINL